MLRCPIAFNDIYNLEFYSFQFWRQENFALSKVSIKHVALHFIQNCGYNHHHDVASPAQISLTLSRHPSLLSIAPARSSRLHPVSAQEGVHRSMSLMSSSLLLQ